MCSAHSLPAHFFIKMFAKYKFKPYLNSVKCGCVFTGRQLHLLFSCPFLFNSKVIQLFNELYNFIDLCLTSANFIMNFPFYFFFVFCKSNWLVVFVEWFYAEYNCQRVRCSWSKSLVERDTQRWELTSHSLVDFVLFAVHLQFSLFPVWTRWTSESILTSFSAIYMQTMLCGVNK